MNAVQEQDKRKWDAAIKKITFEVGDFVLLRNEQTYGLEYNWSGPFIIVDRNGLSKIYKLASVGGESYPSWVHVDRLKEVKADSISTPCNNPTVSRTEWRNSWGLDSKNRTIPPVEPSLDPVSSSLLTYPHDTSVKPELVDSQSEVEKTEDSKKVKEKQVEVNMSDLPIELEIPLKKEAKRKRKFKPITSNKRHYYY
ncbi:hypothetical protein EDC96DRAFT_550165 [Choanephora cucurbitarum]|nr:hypothetical protein EDC96DRAFT_550165 [Choanephora cucurbitarum]